MFEAENTTHSNSSLEVFFQTGVEEIRQNMLIELLMQILHEPCFDQLRTKEQLGKFSNIDSWLSSGWYSQPACVGTGARGKGDHP